MNRFSLLFLSVFLSGYASSLYAIDEVTETLSVPTSSAPTTDPGLSPQILNPLTDIGLTEAQIEEKINAKAQQQDQEFDLIRQQIEALSEQNSQLRNINDELLDKYDRVIDVNVQTSKRLEAEAKLRESSDAQLFIKEQQVKNLKDAKKEVEQDLRGFLSSDVDAWRVIANKVRILKEYKDGIIKSTEGQIKALQETLKDSQKTLKEKKDRLALSRSEALSNYAQRNRELSQLMDADLLRVTKELDSLADQIESLSKEREKQLFDKERELLALKQQYQMDIEKNQQQRNQRIHALDKEQEIEDEGFSELLLRDDAVVVTFEEERDQLTKDYQAQTAQLTRQHQKKSSELNEELAQLTAEHEQFLEKTRLDFGLELAQANKAVTVAKDELDQIESYIAVMDRTADQRLNALKQGHELRLSNFLSKQENLKRRINELEKAADEVATNNREREYVLSLRKAEIEADIEGLTEGQSAVKRAELDVVSKQIQTLQDIFVSVSQANNNVKGVFADTLKKQAEEDAQETANYQKEYQEINEKRSTIVRVESQRLARSKVEYEDAVNSLQEKQANNKQTMADKEQAFDDRKALLEEQKSDLDTAFSTSGKEREADYEKDLINLNVIIAKNTENRNKILRKQEAQKTLSDIQKGNITRHFESLKQRIDSIYESDVKVINADVESINSTIERRLALLKEREQDVMSERERNEISFNTRKDKYVQIRDNALDNIKQLEYDINTLEERTERTAYEQLQALETSRDESLAEFDINLANLDKAQSAFENFTRAQTDLDSERRTMKELVASVMENFNLLTTDDTPLSPSLPLSLSYPSTAAQAIPPIPPAPPIMPKSAESVAVVATPDLSYQSTPRSEPEDINVLKDIVSDKQAFVPQYELVRAGCFMPDILQQDAKSEQICVNRDFYIANHEVTNEQYKQYKKEHSSGNFKGISLDLDEMPAVNVSWLDAIDYAKWLSEQTGQQYRLPTDSEWEYAARGGTQGKTFYPSEKAACFYANVADKSVKKDNPTWQVHDCLDDSATVSHVGSYKPNDYGLYDMLGNVWEWTCSAYDTLPSGEKVCVSINAPKSDLKVSRGGSWFSSPKSVRFGFKYGNYATFTGKHVGFRLVREK